VKPAPRTVGAVAARTVEVLRWPAQADRRPELLAGRRPCLWVLEPGELPPAVGPLEDWARDGDSERDVHARIQRLAALAPEVLALAPGEACVDPDGVLRFRGHRIRVPPTEARVLDRLAATPGVLVRREDLTEVLQAGSPRGVSALSSRIHTLRKRVDPVGLTIHAIRGHGFLLALDAPASSPAARAGSPRRTTWSSSSPPS
jgi:DNA-binding winged helix-turn-helix (wHTH) protein